jgi:hypothetical protein
LTLDLISRIDRALPLDAAVAVVLTILSLSNPQALRLLVLRETERLNERYQAKCRRELATPVRKSLPDGSKFGGATHMPVVVKVAVKADHFHTCGARIPTKST